MAWVTIFVSLVRRGRRPDRRVLEKVVWLLGRGGGPRWWCGGCGLQPVCPLQLRLQVIESCGVVAR
jgi:hypothetical protein